MATPRSRVMFHWPRDPLIWTLALLTAVSGVTDAVCYLALGRVFVANMTGNIVFLGFAAAGAPQLSVPASVIALGAFLAGALAAGRLATSLEKARHRWLLFAFSLELTCVAAATVVAIAAGHGGDHRYAVIVPLGLALGLQNATVRQLAVPDMTTTVLTLTFTGVAADSGPAGGTGPRWQRRTASVALMLAGALAGGLLVLKVGVRVALGLALVLIAIAIVCAHASRGPDRDESPTVRRHQAS